MEDGTHDIREHTDLEEVMAKVSYWEDPDAIILVALTEDGQIQVGMNCDWEFSEPQPTLLEALYTHFPECECKLREWEEEQYG